MTRAASPHAHNFWLAHLLARERPTGLLDLVRHLTMLQIDPTAAIAPTADLVAWSRLGSSYSPAELTTAQEDRTLIELRAMIRPREDLALYRAEMAEWPGRGPLRDWHPTASWQRDDAPSSAASTRCFVPGTDPPRSARPFREQDLPS